MATLPLRLVGVLFGEPAFFFLCRDLFGDDRADEGLAKEGYAAAKPWNKDTGEEDSGISA